MHIIPAVRFSISPAGFQGLSFLLTRLTKQKFVVSCLIVMTCFSPLIASSAGTEIQYANIAFPLDFGQIDIDRVSVRNGHVAAIMLSDDSPTTIRLVQMSGSTNSVSELPGAVESVTHDQNGGKVLVVGTTGVQRWAKVYGPDGDELTSIATEHTEAAISADGQAIYVWSANAMPPMGFRVQAYGEDGGYVGEILTDGPIVDVVALSVSDAFVATRRRVAQFVDGQKTWERSTDRDVAAITVLAQSTVGVYQLEGNFELMSLSGESLLLLNSAIANEIFDSVPRLNLAEYVMRANGNGGIYLVDSTGSRREILEFDSPTSQLRLTHEREVLIPTGFATLNTGDGLDFWVSDGATLQLQRMVIEGAPQ